MANSGVGAILIGVNDDGTPSGHDIKGVLTFDAATMSDQLAVATGHHLSSFRTLVVEKESGYLKSTILESRPTS